MRRALVAIIILAACSPSIAPTDFSLTWHGDVRPIVEAQCGGCHSPAGQVEFTATSFPALRELILPKLTGKTMPPWMPTFGEFLGDRSLHPGELATIESYFASGAKEGKPSDYPGPLVGDVAPQIPARPADISLRTDAPPASQETYRCFSFQLPTHGSAIAWDWKSVGVHHAAGWGANGTLPAGWFDCSQGLPVETISSFSSVGGTVHSHVLPSGVGVELPYLSSFVLQLHSLPIASSAQVGVDIWLGQADQELVLETIRAPIEIPPWTGLSLDSKSPSSRQYAIDHSKLTPPAQMLRDSDTMLRQCGKTIGTATANLKYGDPSFVVSTDCVRPLQFDGEITAVQPHLHKRGKWVELKISHQGELPKTVLRIDAWDYRWEETFYLRNPVKISPGDAAFISCGIGNGPKDQADGLPAHYLLGGLEIDMEMCAVFLSVVQRKKAP